MRLIGKLDDEAAAESFGAYLIANDVGVEIERLSSGDWAVWIHDENQLESAKEEMQRFKAEPDHERYQGLVPRATKIIHEEKKQEVQRKRNVVAMRQRWSPRDFSARYVITIGLIIMASVTSLRTKFSLHTGLGDQLAFCEFEYLRAGLSPLSSIQDGDYWRLFTPILLHLSFQHLAMNMLGLYYFGALIEHNQGRVTLLILVATIALASNLAQAISPVQPSFDALSGNPSFGGMSGVVYGLFGYAWMRMILAPRGMYFVEPLLVVFLLASFFWCFVSLENVANLAHTGGLISGVIAGGVYALLSGER